MTHRNLLFALAAVVAACVVAGRMAGADGETDVLFEKEPNDVTPEALAMGAGAQPGEPVTFRVKGHIDPADDVDRFSLQLAAGDVVGVVITDTANVNPHLALVDPSGALAISNDRDRNAGERLPPESPLPRSKGEGNWAQDAALYTVIHEAGTYVLEATGEFGTTGRYRLDIVVARPGIESLPEGSRQVVFVDFDGATVDTQVGGFKIFGGSGRKDLSPLSDFLALWGLAAADEDAVVDTFLATLEADLSTALRVRGKNGDYAASGTPGEFDVEIRNSRDDADTFGLDPLVARIVVGGTQAESGIMWPALTEYVDPGNFDTNSTTLVQLDQFSGLVATPGDLDRDLNQFTLAAGRTKAELVGRALAKVAAHKVGHAFGCRHTEWDNEVYNLMDTSPRYGFDAAGAGPDKVFGNEDDVDPVFGVDAYMARIRGSGAPGPYRGVHDTLNTIAFSLATGRK